MKPYSVHNHLPTSGIITLSIGAIILGCILGALAYIISNLFYLLVVFPVIIGGIGAIAYQRLIISCKVRHTWLTTLVGCATGILIAVAFYASSYLWVRREFIADFQKEYGTDALTASTALDNFLTYETGSSGVWGFMKFRSAEGDQYTNYLVINSLPVSEVSFTLKSAWAWIYWGVEVLLFALPLTWIGFEAGKMGFNHSANNWYSSLPKQVGSVSLGSKEDLQSRLRASDLLAVSEMLAQEGEIPHPALEIYEQHTNNSQGDILLILKQTQRVSSSKVKRTTVSQWEVTRAEYTQFLEAIKRRWGISGG